MVEITLLEVDLADAQFNAPFARSSGDEPVRGLQRAVGQVIRSSEGEPGEASTVGEPGGLEAESPGRGLALVGAFFVLVVLGWLMRRARRRRSAEERVIEGT